jgi:protein-disulfide isomerase
MKSFRKPRARRHATHRALLALTLTALAASACAGSAAGGSSGTAKSAQRESAPANPTPARLPSADGVPVDANDGVRGAANAPVTIVVFTDLQCPFCAQGHTLMKALEQRYGAETLRVVIKHVPLTGHVGAIPAARVAQAILNLGGPERFFAYLELAFSHQGEVADGRVIDLAAPLGLDAAKLAERAGSAEIGAQVLADVELADRLHVEATPHFRVNGRGLTGIQPFDKFVQVIDAELVEARRLREQGVGPEAIYGRRVAVNLTLPEP